MRKYKMTSNVKELLGHKLFQIKALKDFGDVKAGDLGGYIEKEEEAKLLHFRDNPSDESWMTK